MSNLGDLASLASAMTWSCAVVLYRIAGFQVGAVELNFFKNALTVVLFSALLLILRIPLIPQGETALSQEQWLRVFASAVLGITLGDVFFIASLNRLGAGFQAVVDCLYAPGVIFLAYIMFGETLSAQGLFGGVIVLTAILFGAERTHLHRSKRDLWIGILLGATAQLLMGYGVLVVRDVLRDHSVVWLTLVRFSIANILLFLWALSQGQARGVVRSLRLGPMSKVLFWGTVLGPFLTTYLWFFGFKHTLAGRAAIFNQTTTFFTLVLASIVLKERMTPRRIVAVVLGATGALIVALA